MIGWNGSVLRSFIEEAKVLGVDLRVKYPRLDPLNEDYVEFVKGADVVMIHHFSSRAALLSHSVQIGGGAQN